ncbi:preprotein translocase subunit SecE [Alteromonadaceae bacterium M269]|nr:preprotein translocase subunit SecE [Alteromonadaceae bacterium M269]
MSENIDNPSNPMDTVKWVLAVVLLGSAVAVNQYFGELSVLYRALGIVALVAIALFVAATTVKGAQFLTFAKEARTETRKVVWPTRQEATQTTLIVLVATFVMALLLWGLDGIIVRVVSFVTGLGA